MVAAVGTRRRGFLGLHSVAWSFSSAHGRLQLADGCSPPAALHWTPGLNACKPQIPRPPFRPLAPKTQRLIAEMVLSKEPGGIKPGFVRRARWNQFNCLATGSSRVRVQILNFLQHLSWTGTLYCVPIARTQGTLIKKIFVDVLLSAVPQLRMCRAARDPRSFGCAVRTSVRRSAPVDVRTQLASCFGPVMHTTLVLSVSLVHSDPNHKP